MSRFLSLAAAVALVLTLGAATAEAGKKKKAAPTNTVVGTVTAVSEDGKTITVTPFGGKKKNPPAPTEVKLSDKTKIDFIGVKDKAEQKLMIGHVVIIGLDEQDSSTAAVVAAAKLPAQTKKKKAKAAQ